MAADKSRLKSRLGLLSNKELPLIETSIKLHLDMT